MRRLLALTVAFAAVTVVVPVAGFAGPLPPEEDDVQVELASPIEPLTFEWALNDKLDCDSVEVLGVETTELGIPFSATPGDTPGTGSVVVASDTPPGGLRVIVECIGGEDDGIYTGDTLWAALEVVKVTEGTVPLEAQFVVAVTCQRPIDGEPDGGGGAGGASFEGVAGILGEQVFNLPYGAAGGTKYVYFNDEADCTITEPVNGGALATTIVPDEVFVEAPTGYGAVVTNSFPVAVAPTFTG